MGKILSIIIPVFNVEPYVEKCLRSCAEQDMHSDDYEVIVVNDGSKDGSLNIIKRVAAEYSNFVIIDKPNGGVSSARNAGLEMAQGTFLWFIDSDDWIEKNCLSGIISIMELDGLDALQIGYYTVNGAKSLPCDNKFLITTAVLSPKVYVLPDLFIGGAWATIFRRILAVEFRIRFDEELKIAEDQLFFLTLFHYASKVKRENILVYYYLTNPNSITQTAKADDRYMSIKKIASFDYFQEFEAYCIYLIFTQFFLYMSLYRRNVFKIHKLVRPYINNPKVYLRYFDKSSRRRKGLILYSYFGILFLISYSLLNSLKITVSNNQNREPE